MNKKFSTLLVSALLTSSVGAFAQTTVGTQINNVGHNIALRPTATASETATKNVSSIVASVLYQLSDGEGNVLIQDRNYTTGELTLKLVPIATAPINASLWTIKASDDANSGKNFVYVNKETGFELAIDLVKAAPATAVLAQTDVNNLTTTPVEGCQSTWAWYNSDVLVAPNTFNPAPVYSYYKKAGVDHVIVLQNKANGEVVAVDYPKAVAGAINVENITDAVKLQPVIAADIVLTAADLNRKVDYKYLTGADAMGVPAGETFTVLSSTVPTTASPLLTSTFVAEPVDGEISAAAGYVADNLGITSANPETDYVYLRTATGNQYLYVSPDFFPANSKFLQLALTAPNSGKLSNTPVPAVTGMNAATWLARSAFKVTYSPSYESLVFEPLNALSANPTNNVWTNGDWAFNSVNNKLSAFHNGTITAATDAQDYTNTGKVVIRIGDLTDKESVLTAYTTELGGFPMPGSLKTVFSFADRDFAYLQRATLAPTLYSIKRAVDGKYVVCNFSGKINFDAPDKYSDGTIAQNYNDMPATMWVVDATGCTTVKMENREYGNYTPAFTAPLFAGQLYVDATGNYYTINTNYVGNQALNNTESYSIDPITDQDALTSEYHGYKNLNDLIITKYNLNYNYFVDKELYLDVTTDRNFAPSQSNDAYFEAEAVAAPENSTYNFGAGAGVAGLPQLVRQAYTLKVQDSNLIDNDKYYIYLVQAYGEDAYYLAMTEAEAVNMAATTTHTVAKAVFYLKADQVKNGTEKSYVLIDINSTINNTTDNHFTGGGLGTKDSPLTLTGVANGNIQAHCIDNVGRMSFENLDNIATARASAFIPGSQPVALYRAIESNKTAKLYMQRGSAKQYLYEDCNNALNAPVANIVKDFGYLNYTSEGVQQKQPGLNGETNNTSMYVQYIQHSNAVMPQYLFLVDKDSVADGKWCEVPGDAGHGYIQPGDVHSDHTAPYIGYMSGRFLINLTDSVEDANHNMMKNADKFKWGGYTRLGFVEGVYRIEGGVEYLYLVKPGYSLKDLSAKWGVIAPETFANAACFQKVTLDGTHSLYAFSLRLINEEAEKDFLIESKGEGSAIGSFKGSWVKEFNGTLVVLNYNVETGNHKDEIGKVQELITNAQVFNVEEGLDDVATGIEPADKPATISVTSANGQITVAGAQGQVIAVTNMLGQSVAKTVATSDNTTITVPAGIVIVKVGDEAVKVVVE